MTSPLGSRVGDLAVGAAQEDVQGGAHGDALAVFGMPEPDGDTSPWLRALAEDPDHEVVPGVHARELHELHRRRPTPQGAVYREDVVYGEGGGRPLTLKLYARARPGERRPAVVFVHGGGWASGEPSMHMRQATGLAGLGYVTALVSYRLHPEARWPEPLADIAAAVRWVRANAGRIGADPDRVVLAGASAGGHLSALTALALAPDSAAGTHATDSAVGTHATAKPVAPDGAPGTAFAAVRGLVLWYPVTDLATVVFPDEQRCIVEEFFGGSLADQPDAASPVRAPLTVPVPPTLIVTGGADTTTSPASVRAYAEVLRRAGGLVELEVLPGEGHAFDLLPAGWQASYDRLAAFLARHFPATP